MMAECSGCVCLNHGKNCFFCWCFHFCHWFTNLMSWGGQRPAQLRPGSACRSKKDGSREFKKHVKNVTSKVPTFVTNVLQNEGLKKWSFCDFLGPHPRMVSKASPDRLQGTKACQNGGPELDFLLFCNNLFILFGCFFDMLWVYHEECIDNIVC